MSSSSSSGSDNLFAIPSPILADDYEAASTEHLMTTAHLPDSSHLTDGPPRLPIGQVIANKYKVAKVKRNGRKYQLLLVQGIEEDNINIFHVVKVIDREEVDPMTLRTQLAWLRSTIAMDGRSNMICDFYDTHLHYMVFHQNHYNLATVLSSPKMMPLERSCIQEILLQLISAVQHLHREHTIHADLCPENVEFLDAFCISKETKDEETSMPIQKAVLSSTKIRLAYYGDIGLQQYMPSRDQYRAPEIVFGWKYTAASDAFSVGCIIGEMVLGEPIFPPCDAGPLYQEEKAILYDALSGQFSQAFASKIQVSYPGTFDDIEIRPVKKAGMSPSILRFVKKTPSVRYLFNELHIADLVSSLVRTNPLSRRELNHAAHHWYFLEDVDDY